MRSDDHRWHSNARSWISPVGKDAQGDLFHQMRAGAELLKKIFTYEWTRLWVTKTNLSEKKRSGKKESTTTRNTSGTVGKLHTLHVEFVCADHIQHRHLRVGQIDDARNTDSKLDLGLLVVCGTKLTADFRSSCQPPDVFHLETLSSSECPWWSPFFR